MNSDESHPPSTPGASASPSARPSNLKSRWKRGPAKAGSPRPGATASGPAGAPSFGEITDISSARESLSGEHVRGYEASDLPPSDTKTHRSKPVINPQQPLPSLDSIPAFKPEGQTGIESHYRRESRPAMPLPPTPLVPSQEVSGEQSSNFISLKPDPANDLAPRRIRTDVGIPPLPAKSHKPTLKERMLHRPAPVIIHTPHKIIKRDNTDSREQPQRSHASVPAKIESSSKKPKPQTGLLYLIKRVLGVIPDAPEEKVVLETKRPSSSSSHGSESSHGSHSSHKRRRRSSRSHHSRSHSGNRD